MILRDSRYTAQAGLKTCYLGTGDRGSRANSERVTIHREADRISSIAVIPVENLGVRLRREKKKSMDGGACG